MNREPFANGEYYHAYNRGTDKRNIIIDQEDADRLLTSLIKFNDIDPVGSLYELSFKDKQFQLGGFTAKRVKRLVDLVAYCLNSNHYHLILRQLVDGGISEYLKRIGGYTWYFNKKYQRSGSLFQGSFKSVHIDSNEYLLRASVYVNLNDRVHQLGGETAKLVRSSWEEYKKGKKHGQCCKDVILEQFKNTAEYLKFAKQTLPLILAAKAEHAELEKLLLE